MPPRGLLKEYSNLLVNLNRLLDFVLVMLAAGVAYFHKFNTFDMDSKYETVLLLGGLLVVVYFPWFRVYRSWRGSPWISHFFILFVAWFSVVVTLIILAFSLKVSSSYSREWIFLWMIYGAIFMVSSRLMLFGFLRLFRKQGMNSRRVVIVGAGELGVQVAKRIIDSPWTGFEVISFLDDDMGKKGKVIQGVEVKGGVGSIANLSLHSDVDEVWIALPFRAEQRVKEILHELRHSTVNVRFIPNIFELRLINHSLTDIAGIPVVSLTESPMHGMNRFVKSVEDKLLSSLILLLISPILIALAVAVKMSSPGPVFYRQERVSWNGKPFMMLKFRSMPINNEKDGVKWGSKHKDTTRVGTFIRKTSLDELPQFINVLKGDMSIVGPRPERTIWVNKFKDEIPDYMQKHLVKAGITGWAQVNGWRGDTDLNKRIEFDLYYIENWSIWFDLKIIFMTVFKGLVNKNAY